MASSKDVIMDNMILKKSADQNPSTEKLFTNSLARSMIKALIINRKNPKVKKVTGMVSNTKTGLRNLFKSNKTNAIKSELMYAGCPICTLDINHPVMYTAKDEIISFIK